MKLNKSINSNRIISYIGSKVKLYDFLEETILKNHNHNDFEYTFHDLFAGTSSVSNLFKNITNWNIVTNDMMKFSYILSYFLDIDNISIKSRNKILKELKNLNSLYDLHKKSNENIDNKKDFFIFNEFSANGNPISIEENVKKEMFGNQPFKSSRMFFSERHGIEIDLIKNKIKELFNNNKINEIEKNILLIFLLNYADKNANTTSVYGAYLKLENKFILNKPFLNENLINLLKDEKEYDKKYNIKHYNVDILSAIEKIDVKFKNKNIIYLDPPYSTRSYESNYHILNYIIDFEFNPLKDIKKNSKTAQMNSPFNNPFRRKDETIIIFKSMIEKSLEKANNVYISYNTDGVVKEKDIENIFSTLLKKFENLKLNKNYKEYKRFKSANMHIKELQAQKNKLSNKQDLIEEELIQLETIKNKINENKTIDKNEEDLFEIIWHFQIID